RLEPGKSAPSEGRGRPADSPATPEARPTTSVAESERVRVLSLAGTMLVPQPLEADQRELSERRHRAALEDAHAAVSVGPSLQAIPAEFRAAAEPPRERRKALLEGAAESGLGAKMIDQDDLAAGPGDAREFVERLLGVRNRGDDILCDYRVEVG